MLGIPCLGMANHLEESTVYVCVCEQVCERELKRCIQSGARTETAVGDACGAGTGCGTCLERIADIIDAELPASSLTASIS